MKQRTIWKTIWSWIGKVPLRQKIVGIIVAPLVLLGLTIAWWVSSQLGGWLSYLLSEERVAQAMSVGMRSVFIITVISAVAGLGIGSFLTWILTRPILEMTYVARRVKNGDLTVRAPVWANDEIGELGRTFNDMIISLDVSRQELERFNEQLKHRNRELAVLYELADMANQPYTMHQVSAHGLQQILENTEASAGLVLLFTDDQPIVAASHSLPRTFLDKAAHNLPGFVVSSGQKAEWQEPLIIMDMNDAVDLPAELILAGQQLGFRSLALAPIFAKERVTGLLVMLCTDLVPVTPKNRQLISGICNQLGVTIQNSQLWDQLRQKEQLRAQLLNKIVTAQEEERRRISRELHDETGQALTSLLVHLKILERCETLDDVKAQVLDLRQLASGTLQEVRRLAADLRPAALDDLGLILALEGYIYDYEGKTGIPVAFEPREVDNLRLPHDVEIVLYRIIQESLTNIARHAEANQVVVRIQKDQNHINVSIEDDGCGFDKNAVLTDGDRGLGILGMQERIQLLGGRFSLDSAPGTGTTVQVALVMPEGTAQVGK